MNLVAVYGTLRKGNGNYERLLSQYETLNTELSKPIFEMHSLGGFPALIEGDKRVVIELYNVDDETFARLDRLEGYPNFYDRKQIITSHGDTWIYFQHELSWGSEGIIENGDWNKHRGIAA